MKNKLILFSIMIAFSLILISNVDASVGFKEYSEIRDLQNITLSYGFMQYGSSFQSFPTTLCFYSACYTAFVDYSDNVPFGQPFQAYIQYGLQPIAEWNTENPDSNIDYCNILVKVSNFKRLQNGTIISSIAYTLNETFTEDDVSITKDQYRHFVSLYRGDYAEVYFTCHFTGENMTIETPASFSFTSPTLNCLACQYYANFKKSIDNYLGDAIGDFTLTIFKNTGLFLSWNIQIWITLFFIGKIVVLIALMGAVPLGLYWVYLFVRSFAKR